MKVHKSIFKVLLILSTVFLMVAFPFGGQKTADEKKIEMMDIKKVYQLIVDGETYDVFTAQKVTKDILEERQVNLGPDDKVYPALDAIVEDEIKVVRVAKETVEEEKTIPFTVEKQESADLYQGETRVIQKGQNGREKKVYEIILEDGKEIVRNFVKTVLVKEPVKQVVAYGIRQTVSRGGTSVEFKKSLLMSATGYTHTGNRTYTGVWPSVGIVAVDPKVIPLHSKLYIDGYGYGTAMDVGGSIKGNRIDLFFETRSEALKWGRRNVQVFILNHE